MAMTRTSISSFLAALTAAALALASGAALGQNSGPTSSVPDYYYNNHNTPIFPTTTANSMVNLGNSANLYWLGSDGGNFAPLTSSISVWTMADSYVSPNQFNTAAGAGPSRMGYPYFAHNVLVTASNSNGLFVPTYYHRGFDSNGTRSFFSIRASSQPNNASNKVYATSPAAGNIDPESFWPKKMFTCVYNSRSYLFTFLYNPIAPGGMALARIDTTSSSNPAQWSIDLLPIGDGNGHLLAGPLLGWESFQTTDGTVYIYGTVNNAQGSFATLHKFALSNLVGAPFGTDISQYGSTLVNAGGGFQAGLFQNGAYLIHITNAYDGFSVRYNNTSGYWQAVYIGYNSSPTGLSPSFAGKPVPDAYAFVTIASSPFGFDPTNTSTTRALYRFPETNAQNPNTSDTTTLGCPKYHSDAYVYGISEKTEFCPSGDNGILFTYNNNQFNNSTWVLSESNYQTPTTAGAPYPSFGSGSVFGSYNQPACSSSHSAVEVASPTMLAETILAPIVPDPARPGALVVEIKPEASKPVATAIESR